MWSLLENVSEKRVGVENFNSDARDVLQARVTGGFTILVIHDPVPVKEP
ncbi:uncharacterized protein FRV6_06232 [Fusarium oxysporum]|uniref:Uncharacterized protein n=1 Tax=Fusarium oxysporum TaxID=5507 RepID=A0A2H3T3A6_FUSOX|nr:uncharacterized protein FRV6_06232 [Fusarium oxysporum]